MRVEMFDAFSAGLLSWAPPALAAAIVFAAILVAGFAAQALLLWVVTRFSKAWPPLVQFIFLKTRVLARFAILILAVAIAVPLMALPASAQETIQHALASAAILLAGSIAYAATGIAIERRVNQFRIDVADNLLARKAATQMRVLHRAIDVVIVLVTLGLALMSFDAVRQYGVSLFASAGVAGIVAGLAARPVLTNLLAGMQIALTQPIRIDDVVVVEGEWGRIEELTASYVVIRIWDLRRLIVPLSYFLENPFTNWTRTSADILGYVYIYADYTVPVDIVRKKAIELIEAHPDWDGKVAVLEVTNADARTMELRALMSAADSSKVWNMRCAVREGLIAFLQKEYPQALPRSRTEIAGVSGAPHPLAPAPPAR